MSIQEDLKTEGWTIRRVQDARGHDLDLYKHPKAGVSRIVSDCLDEIPQAVLLVRESIKAGSPITAEAMELSREDASRIARRSWG